MLDLYKFQREDIAGAVEAMRVTGGALLAWAPGTGKTVSAVEALRLLNAERVLVIAPLSTHRSWDETSQGQGLPSVRPANKKNKAGKSALFDLEFGLPGWFIVGPTFMTRADVTQWPKFDVVVIDEVHQVSEKSSRGLKNLLKIESDARLALSGTPARNRLSNLWGVSRILWKDLNGEGQIADEKFWRWAGTRLESKTVYTNQKDQWGNPKTVKEFEGEKETGSIFREMPFVSVHLAREKCCGHHPNGTLAALTEPVEIHETIDLLPEQKKAIREMEMMLVTMLEDQPMISDIPLTSQQRIRQMLLGVPSVEWSKDEEGEDVQTVRFEKDCKSPYLDRLIEILSEDDEPFIVWTSSQKFAEVTVHRLNKAGISAAEYSGKRKADRSEFGKSYRVLVAIPASLGTGSDGLQQVSKSEVWLERDLDETTNEQGMARLFRTGQEAQVRRWIFHDSEGRSVGRYSEALMKRLALNQSLRVS